MIQINLLPDVKRDFLRAQQMKHLFVVASILAATVAIALLALLFVYVQVVQPRHRANVQTDIDNGISQLKKQDQGVKVVTVQGVLEQVPGLQDKKFISSKLFTYLTEFTPRDVSYNEVKLNIAASTLELTGQTTTLERANVLANNLKSAKFTYTQGGNESTSQPFTAVVFSNLGKSQETTDGKSVDFKITFTIDPVMFNQSTTNGKISVNASSEDLQLPTAQPFSETPVGGAQ